MKRRLNSVVIVCGGVLASSLTALVGGRTTDAAASAHSQTDYVVVRFSDPATASYTGGIAGLARTKPLHGQKLNVSTSAVKAYRTHLGNVHANYRSYLGG